MTKLGGRSRRQPLTYSEAAIKPLFLAVVVHDRLQNLLGDEWGTGAALGVGFVVICVQDVWRQRRTAHESERPPV
jgi:hypothetical protein